MHEQYTYLVTVIYKECSDASILYTKNVIMREEYTYMSANIHEQIHWLCCDASYQF